MKNFDFQHWLALLLTPCATAFFDYLQNSTIWDWKTLVHALIATALVGVAIVDKDLRAKAGAAAVLLFVLAVSACGGSQTPPSSTPTAQALAKGSIQTADQLWKDAAQACVNLADAGRPDLRDQCAKALIPARDSLVAAASAFDAWNAASEGQILCAVGDAVGALQSLAPLLQPTPTEAALLAGAASLSSSCSKDGGK